MVKVFTIKDHCSCNRYFEYEIMLSSWYFVRESDVRKVAFDNEMFVWHLLCQCNINLTDKFNVVLESVGFMGLFHCESKAWMHQKIPYESIFLTQVLGRCLHFSCLTAHYISQTTILQYWKNLQVMQLHKWHNCEFWKLYKLWK